MVAILDQKVTESRHVGSNSAGRWSVFCGVGCVFSPRRVSVADVVLLGPASKHLFLSDEAVV